MATQREIDRICLHDLFAEQAASRPDSPAVLDGDTTLTYRELDEHSDRLAAHIRARIPHAGSRVGLFLRRGRTMLVAILAVMKAGCAYVPLDPAYPASRVTFMGADAELALLLTDADAEPVVPDVPTLALTSSLWSADQPALERVPADAGQAAYVIYTSGSTGRPKGVEVSHRNVVALLAACDRVFGLRPDDVWTLFHSCCFDFSVWEMWGAFAHGAALVVVSAETARSPERTLAEITARGVTVLSQVPSVFRYLSRVPAPAPDSLRYVIFGGEPVDIDAVREWRSGHGTHTEFVNMYGITETTVFATYHRLTEAEIETPAADIGHIIGVPLAGLTVRLLDEQGMPVQDRVGEIHIAGAQLAIGYLNRPELTAERYPVLDGDRCYRSGDLAIARADGTLKFVGRADDQVKINGYRIEIGEIEAVLRQAPGVGDVAVVRTTSRIGEPMLTAFYTAADPAGNGLAEQVASRARVNLPSFMVPGRFVLVPALPLNPSGKTDRRALADTLC
jgi:amino acid adenylation domain-containing protein